MSRGRGELYNRHTFYDLGPSLVGRGQLLSGVRRQQQDKGQSDKQDENTSPHGDTLLSPFAPCRRLGQRVAAPVVYIRIFRTSQRFSGTVCVDGRGPTLIIHLPEAL